MDPVLMYEHAATNAVVMAQRVTSDQTKLATPCSEWDVSALLLHMSGGGAYLMDCMGLQPDSVRWPDPASVAECVDALRRPDRLGQRCMSPAGFEWSMAEAAAGTAMDQLSTPGISRWPSAPTATLMGTSSTRWWRCSCL